jgi:hypothetical protein
VRRKVVGIELLVLEAVDEEPGGERGPRDHADAVLARERQDLALGIAVQQPVLVLQSGDGPDSECTLDGLGRVVRDAAVPNLPLGNQTLYLCP